MTTFGDRVYELGGTPVGIGVGGIPILGTIWYVDGTNGSDNYPGFKPFEAKKTIQAALTAQIAAAAASTGAYGDVIYVMPGTYAESLTGDLSKVQIIGVGRTGVRPMARIHPVATAAYTGEMLDSGFENLEFASPSTPTAACAAIIVETNSTTLLNMANSYIDNCFFTAGAVDDVYESCGIILGALAVANTDYEFADYSRISGNHFGSVGGRYKQLSIGIALASPDTSQGGAEYKGMTGCDISHNQINARKIGMKISTGATACTGSHIIHNYIGSAEHVQGPELYGIQFNSAAADQLCFVANNNITTQGAATAAIANASTVGMVQGNIVFEASVGTYALPIVSAS